MASDRITARPDVGKGIGTKYRGDTDTCDVYRDGRRIGTVDSTRDRTGNAWGILPNGDRKRFSNPTVALHYLARVTR